MKSQDNTQSKACTSSIFHAMHGTTKNSPTRPRSFLEEKRWPPREFNSRHLKEQRVDPRPSTWTNATFSQPFNHQIHQLINSVGATYFLQRSNWNCRDSLTTEKADSNRNNPANIVKIEALTRHQVIYDLQLETFFYYCFNSLIHTFFNLSGFSSFFHSDEVWA